MYIICLSPPLYPLTSILYEAGTHGWLGEPERSDKRTDFLTRRTCSRCMKINFYRAAGPGKTRPVSQGAQRTAHQGTGTHSAGNSKQGAQHQQLQDTRTPGHTVPLNARTPGHTVPTPTGHRQRKGHGAGPNGPRNATRPSALQRMGLRLLRNSQE